MAEQVPDPLDTGWELRFTERALADLRASGAPPGIPDDVRRRAAWTDIVERFVDQRTADPRGTTPIQGMGRNDIFALHARDPLRAATWYDQRRRVCWFLAFTSSHDYSLFVERQKLDHLLPDRNDYALLLAERDPRWVYEQAAAGFLQLVNAATTRPLKTSVGRLGGALDTAVVLEVIAIDAEDGDLWLSFTLPVHEPIDLPTNWEYELAAKLPWVHDDDFVNITRQDSFPCDTDDPTNLNYRPLRAGERVLRLPWRR